VSATVCLGDRVIDRAARGAEPFANVALGGACSLGQLRGRRPVQAELVAHHDQRCVQGRADFVDRAKFELLELVAVDLDGVLDGAHDVPTSWLTGV
jgi:hypothetical protein